MRKLFFNFYLIGLLTFSLYFILISCEEESKIKIPSVTTLQVTKISQIKATCKLYITSDGGANVYETGIYWGITPNPSSENASYTTLTVDDTMIVPINDLLPNTQYYCCAFARNEIGIAYGEIKKFATLAQTIIEDIDGNVYKTLSIGNQEWMIENLKTTKYNNGVSIGTTEPGNLNIEREINPKYQWVFNGDNSNIQDYGRLYTWYAVTDPRNVCPSGWHVPSLDEVKILVNSLEKPSFGAAELKEQGSNHWIVENTASNLSGFTALGGGKRTYYGLWDEFKIGGYWWSTTEEGFSAVSLELRSAGSNVIYRPVFKSDGLSVRCVKDK